MSQTISIAVKHMLAAGMPADAIVAAVAEMEASTDRRSAGAKRQERYRRNKASQVTVGDASDAPLSPSALSPEPPYPPTSKPLPPSPPKGGSSPTPRRAPKPAIVLQGILDPMTAKAFADHCEERGKALSSFTAEAVVGTLREVAALGGNPAEAVRLAIKRGWTTLEVDWLRNAGMRLRETAGAGTSSALASWPAERWGVVIDQYRATGEWQRQTYGPRPGEPGCLVPPALLERDAA